MRGRTLRAEWVLCQLLLLKLLNPLVPVYLLTQ